jgi:hypothetical protein
MEASCGSFYWADRVEATSATCYILDPMRRLFASYTLLNRKSSAGRARIAMIRRLCRVMRQMFLNGEKYHWLKEELCQRKLRAYRQALENAKNEQSAA